MLKTTVFLTCSNYAIFSTKSELNHRHFEQYKLEENNNYASEVNITNFMKFSAPSEPNTLASRDGTVVWFVNSQVT